MIGLDLQPKICHLKHQVASKISQLQFPPPTTILALGSMVCLLTCLKIHWASTGLKHLLASYAGRLLHKHSQSQQPVQKTMIYFPWLRLLGGQKVQLFFQ